MLNVKADIEKRKPKLLQEKMVLSDVDVKEVNTISLMDMQGRKKNVLSSFSERKLIIELDNLSKGMYCVIIDGGKKLSRLIVL